jgi:hypothetical protein
MIHGFMPDASSTGPGIPFANEAAAEHLPWSARFNNFPIKSHPTIRKLSNATHPVSSCLIEELAWIGAKVGHLSTTATTEMGKGTRRASYLRYRTCPWDPRQGWSYCAQYNLGRFKRCSSSDAPADCDDYVSS